MRFAWTAAAVVAAALLVTLDVGARGSIGRCAARASGSADLPLVWHSPRSDQEDLDRWCRAVGPPIVVVAAQPTTTEPPLLDDLVVLTWNAHLAEGRLGDLVAALRAGRLTSGARVDRFVLLVQELYRRGPDVPPPSPDMRSARAIKARRPDAPDASAYARDLGLSFIYVPSMRNGAEVFEDRGNAILSTERLTSAAALELPLERQRRVAIAATLEVRRTTSSRSQPLLVVDAHLEPRSSPRTLWLFHNPRPRQLGAILDFVREDTPGVSKDIAGTVVGGDFNTIQGGADEPTYALARTWSRDLATEDPHATHRMGRLDYLFFRSDGGGTTLSTTRVGERFGSDHHPVIGRFASR